MTAWTRIFFFVNFSAAMIFVGSCVLSIAVSLSGDGSPYALIGGACFIWPALAFGLLEWLLYVRKVKHVERPLGAICAFVGFFALFGLVTNAAEAIVTGGAADLRFWLVFGGVCLSIGVYGMWCGWTRSGMLAHWRIKRGRCPSCGYVIAPGTCAASVGGLCSECGKPVTVNRG